MAEFCIISISLVPGRRWSWPPAGQTVAITVAKPVDIGRNNGRFEPEPVGKLLIMDAGGSGGRQAFELQTRKGWSAFKTDIWSHCWKELDDRAGKLAAVMGQSDAAPRALQMRFRATTCYHQSVTRRYGVDSSHQLLQYF